MKKYTALFLVCCLAVLLPAKHIIFDLGGVLLSSSKMKVARSIGLTRFATSFFKHGHYPLDAVKGMFDIIDMIEPSTKTDYIPYVYLRSKKSRPLPQLYCAWLAGTISSEEITKRALDKVRELATQNYFSSRAEQELIERTVMSMFNPRLIARATRKVKGGLRLARELAAKGHTLYILSNWDRDSFKLIYNNPKHKELFNLFPQDHIVISADINDYKPQPSAFRYLLNRFKLNPADCIFFDDQEENIASARTLGIHAYHVPQKRFRELKTQLKKNGIL